MSLVPIVIIPYNTVNVLVSASDITNLLSKFGIENLKVKNLSNFQEAFTHKSYIKKEYFTLSLLSVINIVLGSISILSQSCLSSANSLRNSFSNFPTFGLI